MQIRYVATSLVLAMALAGCQRTTSSYGDLPPPTPLEAQPVQQVQGGQLPPPGANAGSSQFPTAPTANAPQQMASANPAASAPANALDIKKESLVGSWKVQASGASCDMFLTLTNLGSGSRGGTRGCVGELTAMGSWDVSGKGVQFLSRDGNVIATVYKSADNRFDGTTASGQPVSLTR